MNQPMIGLHNALTAHPAANFVGRLVTFAWRCQRPGAINRAIMQGIRFFDIRVCRHRGLWYAAHGCVRINVDPVCTILNIARRVDSPTIRLILEHGNPDDCRAFISLAQRLQATCPNVRFIGGNHKPTWKKLISFDHDNIGDTAFQCVGSMDPHPSDASSDISAHASGRASSDAPIPASPPSPPTPPSSTTSSYDHTHQRSAPRRLPRIHASSARQRIRSRHMRSAIFQRPRTTSILRRPKIQKRRPTHIPRLSTMDCARRRIFPRASTRRTPLHHLGMQLLPVYIPSRTDRVGQMQRSLILLRLRDRRHRPVLIRPTLPLHVERHVSRPEHRRRPHTARQQSAQRSAHTSHTETRRTLWMDAHELRQNRMAHSRHTPRQRILAHCSLSPRIRFHRM